MMINPRPFAHGGAVCWIVLSVSLLLYAGQELSLYGEGSEIAAVGW